MPPSAAPLFTATTSGPAKKTLVYGSPPRSCREHEFDAFVEGQCEQFYAPSLGRPSLTPGIYFRSLLIGYFEGIDSERGVAWRLGDSLSLRRFLAIELDEQAPDHSTISRTRRLIDLETHRAVFTWALQLLAREGLLSGGTMGSTRRRWKPTRRCEGLRRVFKTSSSAGIFDKKRKKKASNKDWKHPYDPDAKVTKMKDGRTHLMDLQTGAVVAVAASADEGDTTTIEETSQRRRKKPLARSTS